MNQDYLTSCGDEVSFLFTGLQSPGTARSTERHDEGGLHGAPQSLVLLHCSRTSAVWDQPDLGVQSGQTTEYRYPNAGHRQVKSRSVKTFLLLI